MKILKYETNYVEKNYIKEQKTDLKNITRSVEYKVINIYPEIEYQNFVGFGGSITEAAGYAFSRLDLDKRKEVIKEIFSEEGLNYSYIRLPIGSCDFSIKSYSYSSKKDLSDFSIEKDREYILPLLKEAFNANQNLKIIASPWSPPAFMKNTHLLVFGGKLRNKYKQTYADYFVKYIKAYKDEGFDINYVTVQNEPNAIQKWESCLYSAEEEADFIVNYLYPTLKRNNLNTEILIWDHNKERLVTRVLKEFTIDGAYDKIAGIAYHYYTGEHFDNVRIISERFPDKLLIHSEGCVGYSDQKNDTNVGDGEIYSHDIIGDFNAGSMGYVDWNLILDYNGGPNHKNNFCSSPVMINKEGNDYFKNPSFTYISHFSRFIKPGAKRLGVSRYTDDIEITAFKNMDNSIVIVVLNRKNWNIEYNMCIEDKFVNDIIKPHSIYTYIVTN